MTWHNHRYPTDMWNEPVLFMRFAKIKDPGHRKLNLVSTDGRHFKVVHLQNDPYNYAGSLLSIWALNIADPTELFYLDNVHTVLPPIPGVN